MSEGAGPWLAYESDGLLLTRGSEAVADFIPFVLGVDDRGMLLDPSNRVFLSLSIQIHLVVFRKLQIQSTHVKARKSAGSFAIL